MLEVSPTAEDRPFPGAREGHYHPAGMTSAARFPLLAFATNALAAPLLAQIPSSLPTQSDRVVSYRIEATLDPKEKKVRGRERVTWRNNSPGPVGDLWFHLYLNAYKNDRSTLMRERGPLDEEEEVGKKEWGWIDVEAVRAEQGEDLKRSISFQRPDDGNPDDETVIRVVLPTPVPASGSVTVDVEWTARFPEGLSARNQTRRGFFLGVQWFPKLGVFEETRERGTGTGRWAWNCHQFHAPSEFYADFGTYDVSLILPQDYSGKVGATGRLTEGPSPSKDGKSFTVRFQQEDVHDFAWVADPRALKMERSFDPETYRGRDGQEEERMARVLGRTRAEIALAPVHVTLFLQPEHAGQEERHWDAVFAAIYWFGLWYGRYPYAGLTVVDPPFGSSVGGMEYPMLITAGTDWRVVSRKHDPEGVLVHEFGHQFWYGLVANNEFEHAWLDEGFNTYSTAKVMDRVFGPERATVRAGQTPIYAHPLLRFPEPGDGRDPRALLTLAALRWKAFSLPIRNASPDGFVTLPGADLTLLRPDPVLGFLRDLPPLSFVPRLDRLETVWLRERYVRDPKADPLDRRAWDYVDRTSYSINSYARPALTLLSLERHVNARRGPGTWDRVMRTYHERYRFGHPVPEDFFAVAEEVSGERLGDLFERLIYGSDVLDYGVRVAESAAQRRPAGIFGPGATGERREAEARAGDADRRGGPHDTKVVVQRYGEVVVPVVIEVKFEKVAQPERFDWDGRDRHWTHRWEGGPRLEWVRVDPERVWLLDADASNNDRRVDPDPSPALRWGTQNLFWVQNVLHFFGGIG
ncbi:MAG TPA: M1 family metallopeptidase [Planctomycetota bacterium]|nr:M1 family metallopeptidase [Planctomycetota bacterium]